MKKMFLILLCVAGCGGTDTSESRKTSTESSQTVAAISGNACILLDSNNDAHIDLLDVAAWQNCYTGPDLADTIDVIDTWDIFSHSNEMNFEWQGLATFLSSGVVTITSAQTPVLYSFDGTLLEYSYHRTGKCNISDSTGIRLSKTNENQMDGLISCNGFISWSPVRALRRP